jgi:hypothetical protein
VKSMVYALEIYHPQSRSDVLRFFESPAPFMSFNEGDLVDPSAWISSWSPLKLLRVTAVVHVIRERGEEGEEVEHKIMVYTEEQHMASEGPNG